VRKGNTVIQAVKQGRAIIVYKHATVLRRQVEKRCIRIFIEESPGTGRSALPWKNFQALLKFVSARAKLTRNSERRIPANISHDLQKNWNRFVPSDIRRNQ
jgi:hypothetical protein